MNRLTKRGKRTGIAYLDEPFTRIFHREIISENKIIFEEIDLTPLLEKLAAYEDTGLEPKEVEALLGKE